MKFFDETLQLLTSLSNLKFYENKEINELLIFKPIGVYYDNISNNNVHVIGIMTIINNLVPIKPSDVDINFLHKNKFILEKKYVYDEINEQLILNNNNIIDNRIKNVSKYLFNNESYELFRLELSEFMSLKECKDVYKQIVNLLKSKYTQTIQLCVIRLLLYKIINEKLYDLYIKYLKLNNEIDNYNKIIDIYQLFIQNIKFEKITNFVFIVKKIEDNVNYKLNNNRILCKKNKIKTCTTHCQFSMDSCKLILTIQMVIEFINKISGEIVFNELKKDEILRLNNYYVQDDN